MKKPAATKKPVANPPRRGAGLNADVEPRPISPAEQLRQKLNGERR